MTATTTIQRLALIALLTLGLAACASTGLPGGLTQRMDQPGAQLNRADAVNIVNQFRQTSGSGLLVESGDLDAIAQNLAAQYAKSGITPNRPQGVVEIRSSAGYATFAETFSGWRNSAADAKSLNAPSATQVGIGVFYSENTPYGTYWVILLG